MIAFVLDVPITMAWCFADEATPEAWAVLDQLNDAETSVPSLWHLEVANVLAMAERRGRITVAKSTEFITLLNTLPIKTDTETETRALHDILHLARQESLSAYDASYLDLAVRLGCPLATKDKTLKAAAARMNVSVIGS